MGVPGNLPRSLPEGPKGKAYPRAHADTQPGPRKHPRQHRYCHDPQSHRDAIAMGKGTATTTLLRQGNGSRQQPCRNQKACRNSDPYRDSQPRRDKVALDWADASPDVATRRAVATSAERETDGILNPRPATRYKHTTQGRGAWERYLN
ncbi:hypothetical protein Taro_047542 [Colocasia esculenta]|uniref:Uncharacterized protein n=1 Tax=Colocasia esculenta TaxID=4460 RepID=A0A843X407_COLES|nr:hypothetical protein [Colocasia esculenta]